MIKKNILILFLVAFLIRLLLISVTSTSLYEHNDSFLHRDWGRVSFLHGVADTYTDNNISNVGSVNNLPPAATYTFASMYYIHIQASKVIFNVLNRPPGTLLWINDGTFANMFLKLPAVTADILIGALIYFIVSKYKKEHALWAAGLYLLNPVVIYNSAVWGQFDAIHSLLFLTALYLLYQEKYFPSILCVGLSLFFKLTMLPLLPLYGIILLFKVPLQKLIPYVLGVAAILVVITLPISLEPHIWLYEFFHKNSSGVIENVTANAYNFWWAVFMPKLFTDTTPVSEQFLFITYQAWGYILYAVFLLPLLVLFYKKRNEKLKLEMVLGSFSALWIITFLFLTTMHERYLFTFFPLMAAYVGLAKENLKMYLIVIVVHAVNIFSVWQYLIPEAEIRANPFLTNVWFSWIMSIAITLAGVVIYTKFIKRYLNLKFLPYV